MHNEREIYEILKNSNENIIKCYYIENETFILELMENGDLFDYVKFSQGQFPLNLARLYFKQMLEAVSELHRLNYAHRDIKLENALLDEEFNLKLSDFGFSCSVTNESARKMIAGTDSYIAP